jgi:hypothetical protein
VAGLGVGPDPCNAPTVYVSAPRDTIALRSAILCLFCVVCEVVAGRCALAGERCRFNSTSTLLIGDPCFAGRNPAKPSRANPAKPAGTEDARTLGHRPLAILMHNRSRIFASIADRRRRRPRGAESLHRITILQIVDLPEMISGISADGIKGGKD